MSHSVKFNLRKSARIYHIHIALIKQLAMKISNEQISLILEGIEDGLTIEQCCKYILHINRNTFYRNATPEQIDIIKSHKFLYSSLPSSYARNKIRIKSL